MSAFPHEFRAMLSSNGRAFLEAEGASSGRPERFRIFYDLLDPKSCRQWVDALDREMLPHLRTIARPIPPETITGMKENYSELLPKSMRVRSRELNSAHGSAYQSAKRLGLLDILDSESLFEFAQIASGLQLELAVGRQVIAYKAGDYSGPHNDHHPENPDFACGYVDVQIMASMPGVKNQSLVYEEKGHLSEVVAIAPKPAIAVYNLPFWHYTTPLVVEPASPSARRWLLLATYRIKRGR